MQTQICCARVLAREAKMFQNRVKTTRRWWYPHIPLTVLYLICIIKELFCLSTKHRFVIIYRVVAKSTWNKCNLFIYLLHFYLYTKLKIGMYGGETVVYIYIVVAIYSSYVTSIFFLSEDNEFYIVIFLASGNWWCFKGNCVWWWSTVMKGMAKVIVNYFGCIIQP